MDEKKNNCNRKKHGISFETAIKVFTDPMRIELFDDAHSEFEERWLTIGIVYPAVLVVIYTERMSGMIYRIISAS